MASLYQDSIALTYDRIFDLMAVIADLRSSRGGRRRVKFAVHLKPSSLLRSGHERLLPLSRGPARTVILLDWTLLDA